MRSHYNCHQTRLSILIELLYITEGRGEGQAWSRGTWYLLLFLKVKRSQAVKQLLSFWAGMYCCRNECSGTVEYCSVPTALVGWGQKTNAILVWLDDRAYLTLHQIDCSAAARSVMRRNIRYTISECQLSESRQVSHGNRLNSAIYIPRWVLPLLIVASFACAQQFWLFIFWRNANWKRLLPTVTFFRSNY